MIEAQIGFQTVLNTLTQWSKTRSLLRRGKRSEYLSMVMSEEERNTKMLIGALLEFGKVVVEDCDVTTDVAGILEQFLRERGVVFNLSPDFQWERECKKYIEVGGCRCES